MPTIRVQVHDTTSDITIRVRQRQRVELRAMKGSVTLLFICVALTCSQASAWSSPDSKKDSRRHFLRRTCEATAALTWIALQNPYSAAAAPPFAVIAEELGYFPVQKREGQVMYIPKKVQRKSTDQAIELAKLMSEKGITMYGAYWCPHCSRQKELFGQEAWSYISYVECAPKGYGFRGICKNIDGYPTFQNKRRNVNFSGERPLEYFAQQVGLKTFDPSLEDAVPMVGTACRLR